jgi:hypothetical protein
MKPVGKSLSKSAMRDTSNRSTVSTDDEDAGELPGSIGDDEQPTRAKPAHITVGNIGRHQLARTVATMAQA